MPSYEVKNIEMVVGHDAGQAFLRFKEPTELVMFSPQNALDVCEALAREAFEARDGFKPAGPALKADLIERHRITLTHRIALMLETLRGDRSVSNGQLAQSVVEACLKEVF